MASSYIRMQDEPVQDRQSFPTLDVKVEHVQVDLGGANMNGSAKTANSPTTPRANQGEVVAGKVSRVTVDVN